MGGGDNNNNNDDKQYSYAKALLLRHRSLPYDASLLNSKYRLYLWSFGRLDFLHRIGGLLSVQGQRLRIALRKRK